MNLQKVVIAIPTEEEFMPSILRWGRQYAWANKEVHFVYVVKKEVDVNEASIDEIPSKTVQEQMKHSLLDLIKNKAIEIMPLPAFRKAHFEVLFTQTPAEQLAEYAKEINAEIIVVATENKRGFPRIFFNSFADRLLKLAPCDVLVLRPNKAPRNKLWDIRRIFIIRWLSASIHPEKQETLPPNSNVHFLPNRNDRK